MGSTTRNWYIIIILFTIVHDHNVVQSAITYDPNALDTVVHDYAIRSIMKARTGSLHNVSLPSNYSGIVVSVEKVRSGSLWTRGVNHSSFIIPPRILPIPFVKRVAMLYQDLGNLSGLYYSLPGYKLVSPVLGFSAYDASNFTTIGANKKIDLSVMGEPISVRFSSVPEGQDWKSLKCVRFGADKVIEMSNMSVPSVCYVEHQGHFCVVTPSGARSPGNGMLWRWWVVGFGGAFIGLVLIALIGIFAVKFARRRRIQKMVRESEKGVAFDTMWIGRSKLPSASMVRTQPTLESEFTP